MTARILIVLFSFFLISCEQQPEAPADDTPEVSNYDYFTIAQIKTAADLRQRALTEGSGAYEILDGLVSEAGGRLPGSEGDAKGVAYMERTFKQLGFDRVWVEPVSFEGWARESASFLVTSPFMERFDVTSLGLSISTPEGGVEGEIVHFPSFEAMVAADASEIEGKIVFISNRMERAIDGSGYGPAVIARSSGPTEAAKKGALALLIRSIGTDEANGPHTGMTRYAEGEPKVAAAAISNPHADQLVAALEGGETLRAKLDIRNKNLGEITTYNVIGEITGATRPDEIVITGGHLDSWDLGVGAMDDGSGVATTTAAVAMIADLPERPARTIRVVAFAAEEVGLKGGFAYGAAHAGDDHVFGSELDFGLGKIWEMRPVVAEDKVPVVREMWRLLGPMGIGWNDEEDGFLGPDLIPLQQAGVAGATLYGDGTRYFDYHHTAQDQMDIINAEDLDFNAAAYAAILYLAAEYEGRFDVPAQGEGVE